MKGDKNELRGGRRKVRRTEHNIPFPEAGQGVGHSVIPGMGTGGEEMKKQSALRLGREAGARAFLFVAIRGFHL